MKLFTKYSRVNLVATVIIFILSATVFYFVIRYILINQVDNDLKIEEREIKTYLKEHNTLPEPIPVKDQQISYVLSDKYFPGRKFATARAETENDSYRILRFGIAANGNVYTATVAKSLKGTDDLTRSILLISLITILMILGTSLVINRVLLKRLWKPFYTSLAILKNFRVDKKQALTLPPTHIDEFAFMNQTLQKTTNQAQQEYALLKEFTENASHEMQTPLAIIRSKLDLLIQNENLSEDQSKAMQSAYHAIEKLSRLNHSLLLLAKIENNQFAETTTINLKQRLNEKLNAFHELWQNQNISVSSSLEDATVQLNNELTDILLNNLLSNATRHNFSNGFIKIVLRGRQLEISNSSREKELNSQQMFSRFFSQNNNGRYNGLGLSIIKQICDVSGFTVRYLFADNQHQFTLAW
jgi:signal transduction histidine kinase